MLREIVVIAEDESDAEVFAIILKKRGLNLLVRKRYAKPGSVSRLAAQLEDLIADAKDEIARRKALDTCIVVLHDADELSNLQNRRDHERIAEICRRHDVIEITAHDELEAWILADGGFCDYLGIRHQNRDSVKTPSDELKRRLNDKRVNYSHSRTKILNSHMDGKIVSQSFSQAMKVLADAKCL